MSLRELGGLRCIGGGYARQICSRMPNESLIGSHMGKESHLGKKWFEAKCYTREVSEGMQKPRRSSSIKMVYWIASATGAPFFLCRGNTRLPVTGLIGWVSVPPNLGTIASILAQAAKAQLRLKSWVIEDFHWLVAPSSSPVPKV